MKSRLWRITLDTNPEDCNLNCIMCEENSEYSNFREQLFQKTGIRRRLMPVDWIEPLFKEAKMLGVKEIIPSTMGEPLLYGGIEKIYQMSEKYDIKINLTTNGTFPKKSVKEWANIIIPNTSDIKISWNGATKETSEKIMKGIEYNSVLKNVIELISYRNDHFLKTGYYCRITFQLTFMQNNMHELSEIIKLAANIGIDRIKGHHLWTHFEEIKDLSFMQSPESIALWNTYVQKAIRASEIYLKPGGQKLILENIIPIPKFNNSEIPESYNCPFLNKELWISGTGQYSPCCAPDNLRKDLGDFGKYPHIKIADVMNSEQYVQLVENYKQQPLCKTCKMRKP